MRGGPRQARQLVNDHKQEIRDIVDEIRTRRDKGEQISIAEVASAHPELMPDLETELKKLKSVEPAQEADDDATLTTHPSISDSAATLTWPKEGFESEPRIEIPDFELLAPVPLNTVCFRHKKSVAMAL